MAQPSDEITAAWTRLQRAAQATLSGVEQALKAGGFPPLGWYDVLLELERAEPGLRPKEIEQRLLLEQYNLSRLLQRLDKAGLVTISRCPEDGRGQIVAITDAGRDLRRRMWPVYAAAIQQAVGSKLHGGEAKALADLLGRLVGERKD
ncbi:MAG: MarR family winged helix-turn-helix transcriptional regulator [Geminicoccaceae bacterium]